MHSLISSAALLQLLSLQHAPNTAVIAFQTPLSQRVAAIGARPTSSAATQDGMVMPSPLSFVTPTINNIHHHQTRRARAHQPLHATADQQETNENETNQAGEEEEEEQQTSSHNPFKQAYHLYVDYFDRLWAETDVDHRQKLARQRATDAVLHVKNMVSKASVGQEYVFEELDTTDAVAGGGAAAADAKEQDDAAVFADLDEDVRRKMEEACDLMLNQLEEKKEGRGEQQATNDNEKQDAAGGASPIAVVEEKVKEVENASSVYKTRPLVSPVVDTSSTSATNEMELTKELVNVATESSSAAVEEAPKKKKKGGRSVLLGASMGLVVAGWVYSGNYIFTGLFTLMTALGQLEYYRMVMNAGIYPARRISVIGACATFITALFAPDLHQIVLPVASTWAMIWFLTMRRSVSTISEIATTFTGMFYLGYIPSFWVR